MAILATAALLHAGRLFSQVDSVLYTPDFEFVEGIYMSYEEFRDNDPSIREEAIITDKYNWEDQFKLVDPDAWEKLFSQVEISYYGPDGNIVELKPRKVWGYSTGKHIYIRSGRYFNRIFTIGAIMHFMELYSMPSFNQKPGYTMMKEGKPLFVPANERNVGSSPHMVDYYTGEVLNYCFEGLTTLLKRDPELFEEFTPIKRQKKKKEQMFPILRRFNDKHPSYFPVR